MKKYFLISCLFMMTFCPLHAHGESEVPLQEGIFTEDLTVPAMEMNLSQSLDLDEATRIAIAQNFDIGIARLERESIGKSLSIAKGVFDTHLDVNAAYSHDSQERASVVLGARQITGGVEASLEKKLPTGTTIKVLTSTQRNSTTSAFTALNRNYTSLLEFSFEQPLLKNFFGSIDRAEIKKVELNIKQFDYQTLDQIEEYLTRVRNQYWNLVFVYENMKSFRRNLRKAQDFLQLTSDQIERGLAEKPDLYAAEANVRKRVMNVLTAEANLYNASDSLKVLLNINAVELIVPSSQPEFRPSQLDARIEVEGALARRRDLKALLLEQEEQAVELKIRSQERFPDLNLSGSYGSTGLDRKQSAAMGKPYAFDSLQYFAGATLNVPLENRAARNFFGQQKIEMEKINKVIEHLHLEINRQVHESLRNLKLAEVRVNQTVEIQKLETQKLVEEEKNFNRGRSDSKTIIDFQEDLIIAEIESARALVDYAKSLEEYYAVSDQLFDVTELDAAHVMSVDPGEVP